MEQAKTTPTGKPPESKVSPPIRKFTLLEKGDVTMEETQTTTVTFTAPEFKSFKVSHQKQIDIINENLSEETRKKLEESKVEIQGYINDMDPIIEESEKLTKENYEKTMMDGAVKAVKDYFKKPRNERKPEYIAAILTNLKKEDKIELLLSRLTPEESQVIVKIKLDLFRKQRQAKK